jgi:hypothetical protein
MPKLPIPAQLIDLLRIASVMILAGSYFAAPAHATTGFTMLYKEARICLEQPANKMAKCASSIGKKTPQVFQTTGGPPASTVLVIQRLLKLNEEANYHETDQLLQARLKVFQAAADQHLTGRKLLDYYAQAGPDYKADVEWTRHVLESSDDDSSDMADANSSDQNDTSDLNTSTGAPTIYDMPAKINSDHPGNPPTTYGASNPPTTYGGSKPNNAPEPSDEPNQNSGSQGSGFVRPVPECGHAVNVNDTLVIENTCDIAVTIFYTSSGDISGGKPLGPGGHSNTAYSPEAVARVGGVEVYTCPGNSTPVGPDGKPMSTHYKGGEYECHR